MTITRINLALTPAMVKTLDKLGAKIGLDRTNTIRYCIARTVEAESVIPSTGHHGAKPEK